MIIRKIGGRAPATVTFVVLAAGGGAGVANINVDAQARKGGNGGLVIATFSINDLPASVIVQVGQGGKSTRAGNSTSGGWPAGGDGFGNQSSNDAGGGGGRSGIFQTSVSQANALVVAGAGGGSATRGDGGGDGGDGGGTSGTAGTGSGFGNPGTPSAGGTGGGAGSDGAALAGGNAQAANGPGGGGDGYWGGEGGADGAVGVAPYGGGGGGSSYVHTDALTSLSLTGFGGQGAHGSSINADDSSPGQNGKVLIIDNATGVVTEYSYTGSDQTHTF